MSSYDEILLAMQDRFSELAGFHPDDASDIGIRLKVLASQIHSLSTGVEAIKRQVFPQTASGEYLDLHAQMKGLVRKQAVAATGALKFTLSAAASTTVHIAKGTICTTTDGSLRFETTTDAIIAPGLLATAVPAQCTQPGTVGNVSAGSICAIVNPPAYLSLVTNLSPFAGGADEETDAELKERLLDAYRAVSNGTNSAFYEQEALTFDGIASAHAVPQARGAGTVDVYIATYGGTTVPDDLLSAVRTHLLKEREIGVDLLIKAATVKTINLSLALAVQNGYDFDAVKEACAARLSDYMKTLGISEHLPIAALTSIAYSTQGVANCRFTTPAVDVDPTEGGVIYPGSVTITKMAGV